MNGRIPPEVIAARLKPRDKDVTACLGGKVTDPVLRLRIVIDVTGHVSSVQTDYRIPVEEAAQACVASALKSTTFPAPEGQARRRVIVVYGATTKPNVHP